MEWNGVEWNGMEWSGMEWNGVEWNGVEWNGMEWNGMEWNGVEWTGMEWNANDEELALETSPLNLLSVANLPCQLSFHCSFLIHTTEVTEDVY